MDMNKIGAILKNRIKECKYSQEDFAEVVGIGLASLKKYMSGAVCYDISCLEKFSKTLHCSYEYLLGETKTPVQQYRSIKDATKLSDGAIERLVSAADEEEIIQVRVFDYLIQNDRLVQSAEDYIALWLHEIETEKEEDDDERYIMLTDDFIQKDTMRLGNYRLRAPELYDVYLAGIMTAFTENLANYGENLPLKQYYYKGQKIKRKQYLTKE